MGAPVSAISATAGAILAPAGASLASVGATQVGHQIAKRWKFPPRKLVKRH